MKKNAYTLAEIVITLILIGLLAIMMISNMKTKQMEDNAFIAKLYKAIDTVDKAAAEVRESEPDVCPMSAFIVNKEIAYSGVVTDAFGRHMKTVNIGTFGDMTGYGGGGGIWGARLPGDVYIGIEPLSSASKSNCPAVINLPISSLTEPSISKADDDDLCWGRLYIDVNGVEPPNELGKDVYIFGLNATGVAK